MSRKSFDFLLIAAASDSPYATRSVTSATSVNVEVPMFEDDGLWPCKCSRCGHEWYSSIVAMRANGEVACSACAARNVIVPTEFDNAVTAARTGTYDFSYLVQIPPQFRSGSGAAARPARSVPRHADGPSTPAHQPA